MLFVKIYNNLFYKPLNIFGVGAEVYFNNFSDSANVYVQNISQFFVVAKYNNFSQSAHITGHVSHNNYYPQGGEYDKHPFRYDPMYVSDTNIMATNPLLIGKAMPISFVTTDIDTVNRGSLPTIGAHEICISSLSQLNNTTITCGDYIRCRFCNTDSNLTWHSANGDSGSTSLLLTMTPKDTTDYYLADSSGTTIDSAKIIVSPFIKGDIIGDTLNCSQMLLLSGNFSPTATYLWTPSIGLSSSTTYNPWASPPTSTTYIQTTTIPGCGIFYDTVSIIVDPLPIAFATFQLYNTQNVHFYNYSLCGDTFYWHFGDGQIQVQSGDTFSVTHHYELNSLYNGFLVVCNAYGCDTFYFNILIGTVDIIEEYSLVNFKVWPNPINDFMLVSLPNHTASEANLQLFELTGRAIPIQCEKTYGETISVDLSFLPSGIYYLKANMNGRSFYKPIVKQ